MSFKDNFKSNWKTWNPIKKFLFVFCWLFIIWGLFMAYHDDFERNFKFLFNIFPDSGLWGTFLYLAPFGILWILYKLLCKGFNVKFGEKDQSIKEREAASAKRFFSTSGKHPYIKFFLINTGISAFGIYLIVLTLNDMSDGNLWLWFLSLPIGFQLVSGLLIVVIILAVINKATTELVKQAKEASNKSEPSS